MFDSVDPVPVPKIVFHPVSWSCVRLYDFDYLYLIVFLTQRTSTVFPFSLCDGVD